MMVYYRQFGSYVHVTIKVACAQLQIKLKNYRGIILGINSLKKIILLATYHSLKTHRTLCVSRNEKK